jgi:hypothetical protein
VIICAVLITQNNAIGLTLSAEEQRNAAACSIAADALDAGHVCAGFQQARVIDNVDLMSYNDSLWFTSLANLAAQACSFTSPFRIFGAQ